MIWLALAQLAAAQASKPVELQWVDHLPETEHDRRGNRLIDVAKRYGLHGEYLVSRGLNSWEVDTIPRGGPPRTATATRLWRWAAVTKQVVATLVMQEVAAGRIDLDAPMSRYLPRFRSPDDGLVTVRQVLRHQAGRPSCAGPVTGTAGGSRDDDDCDFIVAGALLEAVTGRRWQTLVRERISRPLKLTTLDAYPTRKVTMKGIVEGKPEPVYERAARGASAGLFGSVRDLWAFDRALMTGKLLPDAVRAQMWEGQAALGSIAPGRWTFTASLRGCAKPVRIVEGRGAIGGVEVRNFILPETDVVAVVFTDRAGFDFGEVGQGRGFSYDLLSAAAC